MERESKNKHFGKKAGISWGIVSGIIIATLLLYNTMPVPVMVPTDDGKSCHIVFEGNLVQAAEANPGAGVGGILEVFFVNKSVNPTTDYARNDSSIFETWATAAYLGYASADDFNLEIAHSVDFTILIRVRGNETMCDNASGNFKDTYLRVNITSANLNINALTAMTPVITYNDTARPFILMNFYLDQDAGAANLNIARDETAQITAIVFSAYY